MLVASPHDATHPGLSPKRGDCFCCPKLEPVAVQRDALADCSLDGSFPLPKPAAPPDMTAPSPTSFRSSRIAYEEEIKAKGIHAFLAGVAAQGEAFTALSLAENQIGDDGAQVLKDVLSSSRHLRRLNLTHTGLGYAGFEEVGHLLRDCLSIEILVLSGNQPGAGPLPPDFCKGFQLAPNLKALHLSDCGLTAASLRPLCSVLGGCDCGLKLPLERLSLSHNQLDVSAVAEVMRALETNETLQILDMGRNRLGPKGGDALAKDLAKIAHSGLRRLQVDRNGLELRGCKALARLWAAQAGPPLEYMDLRENGCTQAQCDEICQLLGKPLGTVLHFEGAKQVLISWRDLQGAMSKKAHGGNTPMNVYWRD